jgi:large subunit ribosomal protein L17
MRHRKSGRQFSRNTSHRRAMLRALTANLVAHERIETTEAKAKELRRVAERMITRARRLGAVAYTPYDKLTVADRARRQAAQRQMARFLRRFAVVGQGDSTKKIDLVEKVFIDLAKRFKDRPGGYTRIMKLGRRRGDNAPMTLIEFVSDGDAAADKAPVKAAAATSEKSVAQAAPAAEATASTEAKAAEPAEAPAEANAEASEQLAKKKSKKSEG